LKWVCCTQHIGKFYKSEGAGATMHQVYSVMARAGQEELILDSGASAYMTGIKSSLKGCWPQELDSVFVVTISTLHCVSKSQSEN